jgi:hypothetical protein
VKMQPHITGVGEQVFAVAPHLAERTARQLSRETFFANGAEDAFVDDADSGDFLAQGVRTEVAGVNLDFGQLGHEAREFSASGADEKYQAIDLGPAAARRLAFSGCRRG